MVTRRTLDPERKKKLQELLDSIDISIILNFKGGVNKTTIITHIAYYLASVGRDVLLFDCDMQANSSMALLKQVLKPTFTDLLRDQATLDNVIRPARPHLWIVPADVHLDQASNYIMDDLTKIRRVIHELVLAGGILDQDTGERVMPSAILFDTAGLNNITKAALMAAKDIIIPVEYEFFSIAGLASLMGKVGDELTKLNHEVEIRAVIPVKVNETRKITATYYRELRQDVELGPYLYPPFHIDVKLPEAQAETKTIFEYMPERRSAKELEIIAKLYTGEQHLEDYFHQEDQETERSDVEE